MSDFYTSDPVRDAAQHDAHIDKQNNERENQIHEAACEMLADENSFSEFLGYEVSDAEAHGIHAHLMKRNYEHAGRMMFEVYEKWCNEIAEWRTKAKPQ